MTNSDFIEKVIKDYSDASKISINVGKYKIWRGVSHSISSKAEDLFALFVAERLDVERLEFIVDKTMCMKSEGEETINFRPDLAIVDDNIITHIFDLKMDMGYKRRYHEMDKFKSEKIKFEKFRNQTFDKIEYKKDNKIIELNISNKIINQIVVISEKNEGKSTNREDMIESIGKLDWVKIYYLTGGVHPNNYSLTTLKDITIKDTEFERLFNDIIKNIITQGKNN